MAFSSHIITLNRLKTALTEFNTKLQVGGTNLLHGTADMIGGHSEKGTWKDGTWRIAGSNVTPTFNQSDDSIANNPRYVKLTATAASSHGGIIQDNASVLARDVIFSAWVKGVAGDTFELIPVIGDSGVEGLTKATNYGGTWFTISDSEWHKYTAKATIDRDFHSNAKVGAVYYDAAASGNVAYVTQMKLEYGNKATAWSPAPEDNAYIAVGGRNLIKDSNFVSLSNTYWVKSGTFSTFEKVTDSSVGQALHAVQSAAGGTSMRFYTNTGSNFTHASISADYTLSFFAKADAADTLIVLKGAYQIGKFYLTTDYQQFILRYSSSAVGSLGFYLSSANVGYYIANIKLEYGKVPTTWTAAPEDSKFDLLDLVYPVGSIYMSVNNVSPQSFLGGTWEQLKDRFLLGAGDTYSAGTTGGEATHTLTVDEMPSHSHVTGSGEKGATWAWKDTTGKKGTFLQVDTTSNLISAVYKSSVNTANALMAASASTSSIGSGSAHNNMPPYLAVYMWKRTA